MNKALQLNIQLSLCCWREGILKTFPLMIYEIAVLQLTCQSSRGILNFVLNEELMLLLELPCFPGFLV